MKLIQIFLLSFFLAACGLYEPPDIKITDEYSVGEVNGLCNMTIHKGEKWQMEGEVYAVGWNEKFILVKRHPKCNQNVTDYFIIDIDRNRIAAPVLSGVFGPFNEHEFIQKRKDFGVPEGLDFSLKP
jgi:hypothetical protein